MGLTKIFERKKLMLELLNKVKGSKTITGMAILNAIVGRKFTDEEVLRYVKDQAQDSFKTMSNCMVKNWLIKFYKLNYKKLKK